MDSSILVIAGGVALVVMGGYGWWNWHRQFKRPAQLPKTDPQPIAMEEAAKPKRKYTRKPKPATDMSKLQAQSQQTSEPQWPFPTSESMVNGHDRDSSEKGLQ